MIETLCGGDPATVARVRHQAAAMTGQLDAFQLRPEIDSVLRRLKERGVTLGIVEPHWQRLERAGIASFFTRDLDIPPAACILVGDRLNKDIEPRQGEWRPSSSAPAAGAASDPALLPRRPMLLLPTCPNSRRQS